MEFDFPLLPLLPTPITLIPASTFAQLERQSGFGQSASAGCSAFTSNVMIGSASLYSSTPPSSSSSSYLGSSYGSSTTTMGSTLTGTSAGAWSSSSSGSAALSDLEKLGQIVDALGEASAKAQDLPSSITQRLRLAKNPSHRIYIIRSGASSEESTLLEDDTSLGPCHQEDQDQRPNTASKTPAQDTPATRHDQRQQSQQQLKRNEDDGSAETGLLDDGSGTVVTGMLKMGEKKLFIVDRFGVMHEQEACCVLDFYVNEACQRQGYGKKLFDYMLKTEDISPEQIAYDRPSPKLYQFLAKHFGLKHHVPQPNQFAIFEGFILSDTGETLQAASGAGGPTGDWQNIGRRSSPALSVVNDPVTGQPAQANSNTTSSSSFSAGILTRQSSFGPGQRPLSTHQQQLQQQQQPQQQPSKRISSAFTSSIQLGDASDKNAAPSVQQPPRRISSAYTSSIDFSHPSALSTLP
ncbi:Alpha-tubulin N-acetyltransferase 1 [Actinomortierella wolfii]|nr:Alpha-tubulin N-acetyltransferase 1 [Actinomortierella wolfii]